MCIRDRYPAELPENYKTLQEQGFKDCYMLVYHYLMGPAGMDETMVKQMNAAMEEVVNDPTVHDLSLIHILRTKTISG